MAERAFGKRYDNRYFQQQIIRYDTIFDNWDENFRDRYDISRKFCLRYDTINARKFRALGHYVLILYIQVSIATSISGSVSQNCHLISQKIILKHILVLRAVKFVWVVSAKQDHNYSQIATFCDGILRKRDDMIISFNCSQCLRRYKRGWFSWYEILWEFSAISEMNTGKWWGRYFRTNIKSL